MNTAIAPPLDGSQEFSPDTAQGALNEFYRAFNGRDLTLTRRNWHAEECVLDNPLGGIRRGWGEIERAIHAPVQRSGFIWRVRKFLFVVGEEQAGTPALQIRNPA